MTEDGTSKVRVKVLNRNVLFLMSLHYKALLKRSDNEIIRRLKKT